MIFPLFGRKKIYKKCQRTEQKALITNQSPYRQNKLFLFALRAVLQEPEGGVGLRVCGLPVGGSRHGRCVLCVCVDGVRVWRGQSSGSVVLQGGVTLAQVNVYVCGMCGDVSERV